MLIPVVSDWSFLKSWHEIYLDSQSFHCMPANPKQDWNVLPKLSLDQVYSLEKAQGIVISIVLNSCLSNK